jgi:mycoredoxin
LVKVYGTGNSHATHEVRRHLDEAGVAYEFVNLAVDPGGLAQVRWLTGDSPGEPTVAIGGEVLVEPTPAELDAALQAAR